MLKQSKKEQRIKDINESIRYFYIPIKDILEPYCTLLKEKHELKNYVSDTNDESEETAQAAKEHFFRLQEFDKKVISLKNGYLIKCKNNNSTPDARICTDSAESKQFLIHTLAIEEIEKIKQYRSLANRRVRGKFEKYIILDPNKNLNINLKNYLKDKTAELSDLSESVDIDIENYQNELNKYSPEKNYKPWYKFW